MSKSKGALFVVSAPSGAGKTTLVRALIESLDNVVVSVSHTTRPKRPGEEEGVNYFFIDKPEFQTMIDKGIFLEYAQVFDELYGTSQAWVETQLEAGKDVILELDCQGARQIRRHYPEATTLFILPPSQEALEERLRNRRQDSPEVIEKRLKEARNEIEHYPEYDYIIVNDIFEEALSKLIAIVSAHRLHIRVQQTQLEELINKLIN